MSEGPRPSQLELAWQVQEAWYQAIARAVQGDTQGAAVALEAAEHALTILLGRIGSGAGASDDDVLERLVSHNKAVIAQIETALQKVGADLEEVRRQQLALRSAQLALSRIQPQPRRFDERI